MGRPTDEQLRVDARVLLRWRKLGKPGSWLCRDRAAAERFMDDLCRDWEPDPAFAAAAGLAHAAGDFLTRTFLKNNLSYRAASSRTGNGWFRLWEAADGGDADQAAQEANPGAAAGPVVVPEG